MIVSVNRVVSRISTGATAFVCAGVLVVAILTENGGTKQSQAQFNQMTRHQVGIMDEIDARIAANRKEKNRLLDRMMVGSLETKPLNVEDIRQSPAIKHRSEMGEKVGVMELIRENSDIVPPVSAGTDRISVTVKEGDTLYSVARKHGLSVDQLAVLNGLDEPFVIKVGQSLFVAR